MFVFKYQYEYRQVCLLVKHIFKTIILASETLAILRISRHKNTDRSDYWSKKIEV